MNVSATVNYHVLSTEPQGYHIDADGEEGKIISPELAPTEISIKDMRANEGKIVFLKDSLAFAEYSSAIHDFDDTDLWQDTYNQELTDLLEGQIEAKEVIVFDHTVRIDDPNSGRKPARNVHSDYSPRGAHDRLKDIVGAKTAEEWEAGHFGFINVWRPVERPIVTAPLAFIRPRSVKAEDWVELQLIYPDRIGQIMGLVANEEHEWVYLSHMTPNELAYFNIYDNRGLASIGHSAVDLTENNDAQVIRKSIESRTLVRY